MLQLRSSLSSSSAQGRDGRLLEGGSYSLTQIEENRRLERQAASAISQLDSALIERLKEELQGFQKRQNEDAALLEDLALRLENQQSETRARELEVKDLTAKLKEQQEEISVLKDQLKRQDLVLESRLFLSDPAAAVSDPSEGSPGAEVSEPSTSRRPLLYRPRLDEEGIPEGIYSQSFTELIQFKRVVFEVGALRNENALLKTQLERERQALRRQEDQMYQINTSAAEMTLLESNEVRRLTEELERAKRTRHGLEKRCYEAEAGLSRMQREVEELRRLRDEHELREKVESSFDASARQVFLALPRRDSPQPKENTEERNRAMVVYEKELYSIEKTYREREEEIIRTIETVVNRCKELEMRLGMRTADNTISDSLNSFIDSVDQQVSQSVIGT